MKKTVSIAAALILAAVSMNAQGQGKGRGHAGSPPAPSAPQNTHSNAPAGTPHAGLDPDHGRDRAEDVGKGKKRGLKKQTLPKKHFGSPKRSN